jgi:hypothetical protein
MLTSIRMAFGAASICAVSMIAPAWGATVTEVSGPPTGGTIIDLHTDDFERLGNCGGGGSVVNDGCSVVMKDNPTAPHAYGRFDPPPASYWIDSQDIDELKWTIKAPVSFTSLTFALTDAHDQANSHFDLYYNPAGTWTSIWNIATRQANGNLYWLTVDFADAVASAEFRFSTKVGAGYDGFGLSQLTVSPSPIPAPPAAVLLLTGGVAFAGLRGRRKSRRSLPADLSSA